MTVLFYDTMALLNFGILQSPSKKYINVAGDNVLCLPLFALPGHYH